ncbi:MAG TPA: hypothetical protein VFV39_01100 [Limnobacter sp.]|nr:hypothetical protein [Limnobacter sp.]
MASHSILLTVHPESSPEAGVLVDAVRATSIQLFEHSVPYDGVNAIRIASLDFSVGRHDVGSPGLQLGELRCVAQACISDVSLFSGDVSLAHVDPSLLANPDLAGMVEGMDNQIEIQRLGADLLDQLPGLQQALLGELSLPELNALIAQIQANLLNFNSFTQEHYGDLSLDIEAAILQLQGNGLEDLLTSVQVDSSLFAQPHLAGFDHNTTLDATLDGLFTSPESFPLTLDFSNPSSVQEASELFASAGASSISSSATGIDSAETSHNPSGGHGDHGLG